MTSGNNRLSWILPFVLGVPSLLFWLTSARVLSRDIGVFQDELWDFIPAAGMIKAESLMGGQEINVLGYPLPLVTGPYQGALKAWIVAPLLLLTNGSAQSILVLNVIIGVIYLLTLYWALIPVIGGNWASLVFLAPLLDTNLLITGPMDQGPALFQCIFISLAMGGIFRYLLLRKAKYCWMSWLFTGCVLAQKLTAIPIVIGLIVILCALSVKQYLETAAEDRSLRTLSFLFVIAGVLFLFPLLPHLVYFLKTGLADLRTMTEESSRLPYAVSLGQNLSFWLIMYGGVDWYQRITGVSGFDLVRPSVLAVFGFFAMGGSAFILLSSRRGRLTGGTSLVCIFLGIVGFLLFPAFRGLHRPWHFYVLAPISYCCCLVCTRHCVNYLAAKSNTLGLALKVALAVGLAAGVVQASLHGDVVLRRIEANKGKCITSPAIYKAYRSIQASKLKTIYVLNYSFAYPLYVLSKGELHIEELVWTPLTQAKIDEIFARLLKDPQVGVLYRHCCCNDVDRVDWLNHEPEIFGFLHRLEMEKERVSVSRFADERQTEFVLVHYKAIPAVEK